MVIIYNNNKIKKITIIIGVGAFLSSFPSNQQQQQQQQGTGGGEEKKEEEKDRMEE